MTNHLHPDMRRDDGSHYPPPPPPVAPLSVVDPALSAAVAEHLRASWTRGASSGASPLERVAETLERQAEAADEAAYVNALAHSMAARTGGRIVAAPPPPAPFRLRPQVDDRPAAAPLPGIADADVRRALGHMRAGPGTHGMAIADFIPDDAA